MNKKFILIFLIPIIFIITYYYIYKDYPEKAFCAKVIFPDKKIINCELAITPSQHALGLMFRKKIEKDYGMLFVFDNESFRTFWMKNTYVPLDIIYLSKNKKINKIFSGVKPFVENMKDIEIPRVSAMAKYVLEVSSGVAVNLNEGDKLNIYFIYEKEKCN